MNQRRGPAGGTVLTVTASPALDLTYHLDGIRHGETHRVTAPLRRAGGKGLNVARTAHRLGHAVLAIATVGGFSGSELRDELGASGLPNRLVDVQAATRQTIAFVETAKGTTSIFNEVGPPLSPAEWTSLLAAVRSELAPGTHAASPTPAALVASGSLPEEAPEDFYPHLVSMAHAAGIPALIDTSGAAMLASARAGADLLKPNLAELLEATGLSSAPAAAVHLLREGARRVLVSLGEDGMLAFDRQTPDIFHRARLPEPLVGNPPAQATQP